MLHYSNALDALQTVIAACGLAVSWLTLRR